MSLTVCMYLPTTNANTKKFNLELSVESEKQMSNLKLSVEAKRAYVSSLYSFLRDKTEFDETIIDEVIDELDHLLTSDNKDERSGYIELSNKGLKENDLTCAVGAAINYELYFDEDMTLIFGSKLVYQLTTREGDAAVEESNLKRFNVPLGTYSFKYEEDI